MVFQRFLEIFNSSEAHPDPACIFSKSFLNCLMNQAAKENRYLHRAAVKTLKAMEKAASEKSETLFLVLRSLLGKKGSYDFDQRTNSKTIASILSHANTNSETEIISILREAAVSSLRYAKFIRIRYLAANVSKGKIPRRRTPCYPSTQITSRELWLLFQRCSPCLPRP